MDRVDAINLRRNRKQDRHRHDQSRRAIDDGTDDEQDDVDEKHEGDRVGCDRLHPGGDILRHHAVDQNPGEHGRGRDQQKHDGGIDPGLQQHHRQVGEFEIPDPVAPDENRSDHADGGRFRRIGNPRHDRADDDDRDRQRRQCAEHDLHALFQRHHVAARIVINEPAHAGDDDAEDRGQKNAGQHAGRQHVAHRHLRQNRIDDEHDRWRNDRPEHAGIGGEAGGEGLVIALLFHLRHHHLRHDGDLRGGRAEDRRDEHVGEQVHIGEPALHRADKGHRHVDDAAGNAAAIHHLADQHEKGDGDQAVIVDPAEKLHRKAGEQKRIAGRPDIDGRRHAEAKADRHADQHEEGEGCGRDHQLTPSALANA
ncbi:hypothetical protein D3C73_801070 [compost metagenome]